MTTVTYDDRSFLVDGKRIWLVSGSMHYFRIPVELWRDRLLKAKRAGLNCISTPMYLKKFSWPHRRNIRSARSRAPLTRSLVTMWVWCPSSVRRVT